MVNEIIKSRPYGGFGLRKIPIIPKDVNSEPITNSGIDKIKIIELSTMIDKWEQEVLFGEKGYYSLKGEEAAKKSKEYIEELKKFIDREIVETSFIEETTRKEAHRIKQEKLSAVIQKMESYSQEQLREWEIATYEDFLSTTIQRAVFYKNDISVVEIALKNGLKVLEIIADKDVWSKKLYGYRKKQFISDFYINLINAFIKDKEVMAYQYFNQYKDVIEETERKKLETKVEKMRINIIANNWAKEVFSYNLEDSDYKKELNNIKEEPVKEAANQYYSEFKKNKKWKRIQEEKEKNVENWKNIIDCVGTDIDKAELYIDYSFKESNIRSKKEYIRQIRENGAVRTDINEFLKLFNKIFSDVQTFLDEDISDYRGYLSEEDFQLIDKLQKYDIDNFVKTDFDYKYIKDLLSKSERNNKEILYNFIKIYFAALSEYKKESVNLETRTKIIDMIFERLKTTNVWDKENVEQ